VILAALKDGKDNKVAQDLRVIQVVLKVDKALQVLLDQ
jgi:hypothetical protein